MSLRIKKRSLRCARSSRYQNIKDVQGGIT
jgi:hypothetical protein